MAVAKRRMEFGSGGDSAARLPPGTIELSAQPIHSRSPDFNRWTDSICCSLYGHLEISPELIGLVMFSLMLDIVDKFWNVPPADGKSAVCALPFEIPIWQNLMVNKMRGSALHPFDKLANRDGAGDRE